MTEATPTMETDYLASKSRIRTSDLIQAKGLKQKWVMLTSYDAISAKIFDTANIPCILVGDSAAQAVYGYETTLPITMDEMIPLARGVASNCSRALVVADLPFGSYQKSPEAALESATRFMKDAHVHAVKLEGGKDFSEHVRLLTRSGVPVMAHIGFTPQSEHALGGIKIQGRDSVSANKLLEDALSLQEAGAFACVIEMVPSRIAKKITETLNIPTIGIGAGPHCDAQVLVWTDMAGFIKPKGKTGGYLVGNTIDSADTANNSSNNNNDNILVRQERSELELSRVPKFVKKYANMSEILFNAAKSFANDVRLGTYPADEHCYKESTQ